MRIEPIGIDGAWVCSPSQHADDRGVFLEWFRGDLLAEVTGRTFDVVQANHSISRRGVVRGIHFSDVPPGQAKFVYCVTGSVLDVVVDLRVGSPTFGRSEAVTLDDVQRKAVFISEGLGHAFRAVSESAAVTYLVSSVYDPQHEHTISPTDAALGLPWRESADLVVSERDAAAPTLAEVQALGLLPTYSGR